jgi:hypothetical protein
VLDEALIVTNPKESLSTGVDTGLSRIQSALGATSGHLDGALKSSDSVDAALRAALLQYSSGELNAAKGTVSLIGSDNIFRERLASMVENHFGLKSGVLES